jgi:AP-2 complex subunit alpha
MYRPHSCSITHDLRQSESVNRISADIQWVNLFPEIKEHLINIFERYTHVLDAELQQRACEYLALARREDGDELLATICDEMPVFPERESALVSRLHKKGGSTQDKRTWVIGGRDENRDRTQERFREFRKGTGDSLAIGSASRTITEEPKVMRPASPLAPAPPMAEPSRQASLGADEMMGTTSRNTADDIMSSLAGLDMSGHNVQEEPLLPDSTANGIGHGIASQPTGAEDDGRATLGGVDPFLLRPLTVGPNIDKWYERLTYANEGVLYEDDQIQIGIKAEYHANLGRIALFIGNKIASEITDLKFHLEHSDPESLHIRFHDPPVGEIAGRAQIQELVHVDCRAFFKDPPVLRMSFMTGKQTNLVLRLPVVLSRFVEGVLLDQAAFFERWKIIGGKLL